MHMVNGELEEWIKKAKSKGYSNEQIYKILLDNGYDKNTAYSQVKGNRPKKLLIILGGFVVLIALGILFFYLLMQPTEEDITNSTNNSEPANKSELEISDCPPCKNCENQNMRPVMTPDGKECRECMHDDDCKKGYICIENKCTKRDSIKEGAVCSFDSDCPHDMHCGPANVCLKNSSLSEFESCKETEARRECKNKPCENCKDEEYSCVVSPGRASNYKCVQCFMNMQCKEGYKCKEYECVS